MCCARAVKRPVAALHCAAPSRSNRAVRLQRGACWPRRPLNSRARHHVARLPPANPPPSCTTHPAGALNPDDSCAGLCSAVPLPPNPVEHVSSLRHSRRGLRHAAAAGWLTPRQRTPATGATSRAATVSRSDHHGRAAVLCRRQPGSPPSPSRPCCGRRAGGSRDRRPAHHVRAVVGVQEAAGIATAQRTAAAQPITSVLWSACRQPESPPLSQSRPCCARRPGSGTPAPPGCRGRAPCGCGR